MNPRLRRLYADWEQIQNEFAGHPYIDVEPLAGNPPERYRVTYRVTGLRLDRATNRPVRICHHVAELYLHQDYPREKPKCVMETECFHPNVGSYICIDDYWAAGESIADIIIQIGEMIQYRNYNPKSPLDPVAARWAEQNRALFPIGHVDLYQPEVDIDLLGECEEGAAPEETSPETPSEAPDRTPEPAAAPANDLDIELQ
jgi:ubiquitin-protein ligase